MRALACLLILVWFVPLATAQAPHLILGTEDQPELPLGGPVSYTPAWTGPHDDHLRILAGWFGYDNVTDEIDWTLKVGDGKQLAAPPSGWETVCQVQANLTTDGATLGTLAIGWVRYVNGSVANLVEFIDDLGGASNPRPHPIAHTFEGQFESPGYFRFHIDRVGLMQYGDAAEDLVGDCYEILEPIAVATFHSEAVFNNDESKSQAVYSFTELRRVKGPEGRLDPVEGFLRSNDTRSSAPTTTSEAAKSATPGTGALGATLAVAALAVAIGRRRGSA